MDQLQRLIDEGKLDEAFSIFKEKFISDDSYGKNGQIYTSLFESYITALNKLNDEESQHLDDINAIMKEIVKKEKKLKDEDAAEKIKNDLLK